MAKKPRKADAFDPGRAIGKPPRIQEIESVLPAIMGKPTSFDCRYLSRAIHANEALAVTRPDLYGDLRELGERLHRAVTSLKSKARQEFERTATHGEIVAVGAPKLHVTFGDGLSIEAAFAVMPSGEESLIDWHMTHGSLWHLHETGPLLLVGMASLPPPALPPHLMDDARSLTTPPTRLAQMAHSGHRALRWAALRNPSLPSLTLRDALVAGSWPAWLNPAVQLMLLMEPGNDLLQGAARAAADASLVTLFESPAMSISLWRQTLETCLAKRDRFSGERREVLEALASFFRI